MKDELQRWLDGEIDDADLQPELRPDANRWDTLLLEMREGSPRGMPAGLEARVLRAVAAESERGGSRWTRFVAWCLRPSLSVSPLGVALGTAAAALLLLRPWVGAPPAGTMGDGAPPAEAAGASIYVEFVLEAPTARSVAVAGDFSGWAPTALLQDTDGDGVWSGRIRLEPGVHKYMFVVDDSHWVTDPGAERYVDDGFGNQNAVVAVLLPTSES